MTEPAHDPRNRFALYRLCECPECDGKGKGTYPMQIARWEIEYGESAALSGKCPECRGEGRIRQCMAECETAEAVGVALVTLGREAEWEGCAFGLLDREGETNQKWLVLPWLPSARNVTDAARTLARSKRSPVQGG